MTMGRKAEWRFWFEGNRWNGWVQNIGQLELLKRLYAQTGVDIGKARRARRCEHVKFGFGPEYLGNTLNTYARHHKLPL